MTGSLHLSSRHHGSEYFFPTSFRNTMLETWKGSRHDSGPPKVMAIGGFKCMCRRVSMRQAN